MCCIPPQSMMGWSRRQRLVDGKRLGTAPAHDHPVHTERAMTSRRAALLLVPLLAVGACTGSGEDDAAGDDASASPTTTAGEVEMGACEFEVPAGVEIDCGGMQHMPVP